MEHTSSPSCHGIANARNFMNMSCSVDQEIAVKGSVVSQQPEQMNCSYDNILERFSECCKENSDCKFQHMFKEDVYYTDTLPEMCNGRQTCLMQPPQIRRAQSCDPTIYPEFSVNFMQIIFTCVESKKKSRLLELLLILKI